jgi:uncharacterized membrane protein (UPF0127 family)
VGSNERRHRRSIKQAIFLIAVVAVGYFAVQTFMAQAHAGEFVKAKFVTSAGTPTMEFSLELAVTTPARTKGLMFRRIADLPPERGMLFIFPDETVHSFWMKNTLVPLDMIFVDASRTIVGIVANATPLTMEPRTVGKSSKYVIELVGGTAKKIGIAAGDKVELPQNLPPGVF